MILLLILGLVSSYVVFKSVKWVKEDREREKKRLQAEEARKKVQKIKEKVKRIKRKKL